VQRDRRVLVVDDDPAINELLSSGLRFVGFAVDVAARGYDALAAVAERVPDVVVLDVMLPDCDGFEVCRRLRERGVQVPVVFLTARDTTDDKVNGLRLGGDDYLTKPFSFEELVARIESVLRRFESSPGATRKLVVGDLVLDEDAHLVTKAGVAVTLSATEFNVLRFLMVNAGRVVSRAQILDHVWQFDFNGESTVVETYISYLRKKLDRTAPTYIHTIRGIGYVLRPGAG
jgi:two-component system OmpR family response regulator